MFSDISETVPVRKVRRSEVVKFDGMSMKRIIGRWLDDVNNQTRRNDGDLCSVTRTPDGMGSSLKVWLTKLLNPSDFP